MQTDQQQWIFGQFNGTTFQANTMDVQHEPLYDESTFAAAATIGTPSQFFVTGNTTGKTLAQTNVTTPKRLDAPEAFAVMGIRWRIWESTLLADLVAITDGSTGFCSEFWIGQKSYNRGPLWFYNAGGGPSGYSQMTGFNMLTNGVPSRQAGHCLEINIVIDNQASFYAQLVGTAVVLTAAASGGVGTKLMVLLDGLHARGVQ
jgi:hypothetical protein